MAAVPYIPPSFGQPGVSISYQPKSLLLSSNNDNHRIAFPVVTVAVPPASIHHIFAHRQWRAGMLMSDALLSSAFPTANRTILELGAGTGLPSITAALIGDATLVVASDYDEPLLVKELRDNVKRNLASASDHLAKKCKVVGHIWGKDTEEVMDCLPRGKKAFDSVLLADCMWDPLSHADLLKTVVKVLNRDRAARVNVIAGLHTGREKVTSFIRRAYRVGLRLAHVEREDVWPALPKDAVNEDPDVHKAGNEAFAQAKDRILELEVCGNTPVQQQSADSTTSTTSVTTNHEGDDDQPRLTGNRRLFLIEGYGQDTEGDVKLRNRWLTVWSLEWANP
ncbi:related to NNT1 - putative nicotinamide N-methyltransferase [Ustilago trichophora]|uniref:Related to NNT1 - putative nicotinamide N-methyltransferase n=1 Tax=Ustilago trichophora TaxID=86804 RepID=A0A5C3DYN0_9BASI|nr:related to NNT1 - putative nicotinamide N-methyltransferase [Ustilago trichophora]